MRASFLKALQPKDTNVNVAGNVPDRVGGTKRARRLSFSKGSKMPQPSPKGEPAACKSSNCFVEAMHGYTARRCEPRRSRFKKASSMEAYEKSERPNNRTVKFANVVPPVAPRSSSIPIPIARASMKRVAYDPEDDWDETPIVEEKEVSTSPDSDGDDDSDGGHYLILALDEDKYAPKIKSHKHQYPVSRLVPEELRSRSEFRQYSCDVEGCGFRARSPEAVRHHRLGQSHSTRFSKVWDKYSTPWNAQ